jgi:hypothetical protein
MPSFARRLPEREFECFLFGTAIVFYLNAGFGVTFGISNFSVG